MNISKNKNGKWVIDFTCRGRRITRVVGENRNQAEEAMALIKADILRERYGFVRPRKQVEFAKFAEEFLQIYAKQNKRSWRRDLASLKNLRAFFKGMLGDITAADVERYKAHRQAQVSDASTNRELACLKTMLNKAVEWGRLEANPARQVKSLREYTRKERILTAFEAQQLLEKASPNLRPVISVALNTGMRKDEILGLRWADVDMEKGYIRINGEDSKSGKGRSVPMNMHVMETLQSVPRSSEYVFPNPETKGRIKNVRRSFLTACKKAHIKGLRFHDLRHTAATAMVEADIDLVTVSKILGHSSIQMTMRYSHPTPENMRRAVEKLGERFNESRDKVETIEIKRPVSDLRVYN